MPSCSLRRRGLQYQLFMPCHTCAPAARRAAGVRMEGAGERCSGGGTKQPKAVANQRWKRLVRCCAFGGNTTLLQRAGAQDGSAG